MYVGNGIVSGTICIISNGSFDLESPIGPAKTPVVILVSSTKCDTKFYAKKINWVTGSESDQSAYQSDLAGVISMLPILDILVCHHYITGGGTSITLDGKAAMNESRGEWPLNIDQKSFDLTTYRSSELGLSYHHYNFDFDIPKVIKLTTSDTIN